MSYYYPNEIKAAKQIFDVYDKYANSNFRNYVLDLIGMLQAGKTGSFKKAVRDIATQHEKNGLGPISVTVLTTYALKDLNYQLLADMQEIDDIVNVKRITRLSKDITKQNIKELDSINDGIVIIDEGEYGVGSQQDSKDGKMGRVQTLVDYLIASGKSFLIMIVGASNYTLNVACENGELTIPYSQVIIEPGEGYRGVEDFMKSNKFYDVNEIGGVLKNGILSDGVLELLDKEIENNDHGIYLMRASDRQKVTAEIYRDQLEKRYMNPNYNTEVVTIYSEEDYEITERLKEVLRMGRMENTIIIVCGAMAAGFRINEHLKPLIRFIFETSQTQSTAVQGLVGRACGYNIDYMPTIITRRKACQTYVDYQNSVRGIGNFNPASGKVSTHLEAVNEIITHVPAKILDEFDISELDDFLYKHNIDKNDLSAPKENVQHADTQRKFRQRDIEVKKLKSDTAEERDRANYRTITWEIRGKMKPFTVLKYKNGNCILVAKNGAPESICQTSAKNKSFYKDTL